LKILVELGELEWTDVARHDAVKIRVYGKHNIVVPWA